MNMISLDTSKFPKSSTGKVNWGQLAGCSKTLAIANAAKQHNSIVLVITPDSTTAKQITDELQFITNNRRSLEILNFPDLETLPYDHFSPHQDIISERLFTLSRLPTLQQGILVISIATLLHYVAPRDYLSQHSLTLDIGQKIDLNHFRTELETYGYRHVSQVFEHGEYSIRGSIIDLYPMGSDQPFRIDLFDEEIDSIRTFDPETQCSIEKIEEIKLLPAKEFPTSEAAIDLFSENFRDQFKVNVLNCPIYKDVNSNIFPAGIEYYFPLFFETTATLFDYLPKECLIMQYGNIQVPAEKFWDEINSRYEQLRHDIQRPILPPEKLFLRTNQLNELSNHFSRISLHESLLENKAGNCNFNATVLPDLSTNHKLKNPLQNLQMFIESNATQSILFSVETLGRREALLKMLETIQIKPTLTEQLNEFSINAPISIIVAPFDQGFTSSSMTLITESHLSGRHVKQQRRKKSSGEDYAETIIKNLIELNVGDPVVHIEHGVSRYLGLKTLSVGNQLDEYLLLEYANQSKLYVPVSSLHLISRYSGADPEHAPLHKLGTDQWDKAKRKAAIKVRDVAVELLDIYARRAARKGFAFKKPDDQYLIFADEFPFEETPDQETTIEQVLLDMQASTPMDRLVCGDVGFGKTEVALRAAFLAVQNNKQVGLLVPTTLLAQQHYETFSDRFADWPVSIEVLSRFRSPKQQKECIQKLSDGKIDIIIGTHKLLQSDIKFSDLGLLIIDEEHRFGVRQKEKLKSLRSEVDILTLTATPIPRISRS